MVCVMIMWSGWRLLFFSFYRFFNQFSIAIIFFNETNEGGALLKMEGLVLPMYRLPFFGGWVGWWGGERE